ncbi:MAG: hypothetical protein JW807_11390 [Spirochaetes bacterium]|nr:hypothetical protein [Spirochaetota bacterium]
MVYIIGVDHLVQYNGPVPDSLRADFRDYIIHKARDLKIVLIAEEFSEEALHEVYHATSDTAREAAVMLGIEHRYCDPSEADLRKLGIPYYAEVRDRVKRDRGITAAFILDDALRKDVERETREIVRSHWSARERFWHKRIFDRIDSPVLFICGHEHAVSFQKLLIEQGHHAEVIEPFWKRELFVDYSKINL